MYHPVSAFIGLRYLRGRSGDRFSRFVSLMSTAGITIGVLSLVTVLSVMNGFESQLKGRILGVLPHAVVHQIDQTTEFTEIPPSAISTLPHVKQVAPIVRSEAVIQSPAQLSVGLLLGISPLEDDPISKRLMGGK